MELATEYGYNKLLAEIKQLREVERPNIVKEIDIARDFGDLKENAEYHAAKEKQVVIEARIAELSALAAKLKVVDPASLDHSRVNFGSCVTIENLDTEAKHTYTIVGVLESDPNKALISSSSPIARALMGKEIGDEISVEIRGQEVEFEVLDISYKPLKLGEE